MMSLNIRKYLETFLFHGKDDVSLAVACVALYSK